jgi:copper(I)-binding protein
VFRSLVALGLLALAADLAFAAEVRQGGFVVSEAWARATPERARTGAVYVTLRNESPADATIVGADTPRAQRTELHTTRTINDVARMERQVGIALPRGRAAELKPGGAHIMLLGLSGPLRVGESFPLTLKLSTGETLALEVQVR